MGRFHHAKLDVEGERVVVGPREFVRFPRGVFHQIVEARPPYETLMIRSASVDDKIYHPPMASG